MVFESCDAWTKRREGDIFEWGPLHAIVVFAPLEKWGIDVVGALPKTQSGKEFILVATNYMTKWVEVMAISLIKRSWLNSSTVIFVRDLMYH